MITNNYVVRKGTIITNMYSYDDLDDFSVALSLPKPMIPIKLGLRLSPPALLCVYEQICKPSDEKGKYRIRTIPLRNIGENTSMEFLLEDLKRRHEVLASIPNSKIIKMIEIIKQVRSGKGTLEELIEMNQKTISENVKKNDANENEEKKSSHNADKNQNTVEEDTDFEIDDELPLDKFEDEEEDDFWNL